jgi:hypothetical protein
VYAVEPVCGSVGVGDGVADIGFISSVDPRPIGTRFALDVNSFFIKPEYEAAFGDEHAEDSADDRLVPELSKRDKALLQWALAEHAPEMPDYWDLSQAHRAVVNGLRFDDSVPLINHDNIIIRKGIIFKTMEAMKIWLAEYALFHHHPFMVKHSDDNKRYVLTCHRSCPWIVHARKEKDDSWRITSVVQSHTCLTNVVDMNHTQLSSRFISQRLVDIIKKCTLLTVTTLIEVVIVAWGYRVKYGRIWWAKQYALKLIYGDWAEAYKRLPTLLHAMKAKNPEMHFKYVPKPEVIGPEGRQYFLNAFWTFEHCVEAFKHCCDMLSIDGTFLTEKYEGTMLIAIGIDVDRQLMPLAFAIMEKENNGSWGLFLHLVRRVVVGPRHEICVILDRHARILNVVCEVIPNHSRVHYR